MNLLIKYLIFGWKKKWKLRTAIRMTCKLLFHWNVFWLMYFEQLQYGLQFLKCNANTWMEHVNVLLSHQVSIFHLKFQSFFDVCEHKIWRNVFYMISVSKNAIGCCWIVPNVWRNSDLICNFFPLELFTLIAQLNIPFTFGFDFFSIKKYIWYSIFNMILIKQKKNSF